MSVLATSLSGAQLTIVIVIAAVCVLLFAANAVLLYLFLRKRKQRKMENAVLQERRERLEEELETLKAKAQKKPDEADKGGKAE